RDLASKKQSREHIAPKGIGAEQHNSSGDLHLEQVKVRFENADQRIGTSAYEKMYWIFLRVILSITIRVENSTVNKRTKMKTGCANEMQCAGWRKRKIATLLLGVIGCKEAREQYDGVQAGKKKNEYPDMDSILHRDRLCECGDRTQAIANQQ